MFWFTYNIVVPIFYRARRDESRFNPRLTLANRELLILVTQSIKMKQYKAYQSFAEVQGGYQITYA